MHIRGVSCEEARKKENSPSRRGETGFRELFSEPPTGGGSKNVSDRPTIEIQQQTAFGDDGQLEVTETSVETSLEDFGADVDHRERNSRVDRPEAEQFGIDDRPEVAHSSESDQSTLFADTTEDQRTLTGDDAMSRCLFED